MEHDTIAKQIAELTERIHQLPKGYISQKTISGKVYFYHQWTENGKKQSKYLRDDEIATLTAQIEERKRLQAALKTLRSDVSSEPEAQADRSSLNCTLMHKRIKVADLELDDATGFIRRIGTVYAKEHLPVGIAVKKGVVDRAVLNTWWADRSIPASRSGVREALEAMEIKDTKTLLVRCFGLSLSDQYWICPDGINLKWEDVNFFDNAFSDDVGDILFGSAHRSGSINFHSPDSTSDGNLKKRWKIINTKRCLIKGGSNPFRQQPFNEVIATGVMERLGIAHIPYTVAWIDGFPYSVCEDFITEQTELVPAWRIIQAQKKANDTSLYRHFVNCAMALGIPDVVPFLDRMIVLDYILANEDRHLNNFGAIRNAETLEWLGMAPIYDSGSSLGYDKVAPEIRAEQDIECKPFKKHHEEQLKLVTDFSWIDFDRLSDVKDLIMEVLSAEKARDYMDEKRIDAIVTTVARRIERTKKLAQTQRISYNDTIEDDVTDHTGKAY